MGKYCCGEFRDYDGCYNITAFFQDTTVLQILCGLCIKMMGAMNASRFLRQGWRAFKCVTYLYSEDDIVSNIVIA
jgi:hypothetical protein